MKKLLFLLLIVMLSTVSCTTTPKENTEPPQFSVEGLERIANPQSLAEVWVEPGANLAQYNRVNITEPRISFKKNWQRNYNRGSSTLSNQVKARDMDRIKEKVAELFMEVFTEELTTGGYELTKERAEDVLLVNPAIIDLDVNAPDIQSASRNASFTESAGSMTLQIELFDSETGDLLAKALDPKSDRYSGYMQWQTGPANRSAAKRMMKPWAEALKEGLDRARN